MISVGRDGGAVFTAVLPGCLGTSPEPGGQAGDGTELAGQPLVPS